MSLNNLAAIVLAAGRGKRMGSETTKLLHEVAGKPLIYYSLQNLKQIGISRIIAVVSQKEVEDAIFDLIKCDFVYQEELLGTADAVKKAIPSIPVKIKTVLVVNGDDATFYSEGTLQEFLQSHIESQSPITLMTMKTSRKMEVGRVIREKGEFSKILENKEFLSSGARSNEIVCGAYLINVAWLKENIEKIEPAKKTGEYYLTDLFNIAKEQGTNPNIFILEQHNEWIGVNTQDDLKYAEKIIRGRENAQEE